VQNKALQWLKVTLAASNSAVDLGKSLFPIFALALNIPENFFDDKVRFLVICSSLPSMVHLQTQHSAALMKLLHYPPQTGPINERVIGIGAHTE
jgi:isopenicillin N synthase-like dioxygenase